MDLQRLATQLRVAFPTASIITPLQVLGEGFGSVVVETADGIVFRIAKHADTQHGHQRERRMLPIVQRHSSGLRVPEVRYYLDASAAFPYGVIGCTKLSGRPLSPDDINQEVRGRVAGQVAEFLTTLRGIDVGELSEAGLPRIPPSRERLTELQQNVSPYLAQHLSRREHHEMHRWWDDLLDYGQRYSYVPA